MAQNWTNTVSTIGTASRNFIDPTTWDAAIASDITTGGGTNHVGLMYADSVFTDTDLVMGPSVITNQTRACAVKLSNAPGEKPIWRPGTGAAVSFYLEISRAQTAEGILFDGVNRSLSNSELALLHLNASGPGGVGGATAISCTAINSSANGFRTSTSSSPLAQFIYCLGYDNAGDGIFARTDAGAFSFTAFGCGMAFNTGWGYGFLNATATCAISNSWARGNTAGSIESIRTTASNPGESGWIVIDDARLTALSATLDGTDMVNVLESATQAQFAFTNEAGRDFTPGTGSVLLNEGPEFGSSTLNFAPFDVNGNRLSFNRGDRMDVGPIQSSLTVLATADEPDLAVKSEGDGQVVVTASNVASGGTVTVFYRERENLGTLWTSGGTRVGNGDVTVSGLTNGVDYYFICKVDT